MTWVNSFRVSDFY